MYVKPSGKGFTVYTKSDCPACTETKKAIPEAVYVNCDAYLEEADEFLDFVWSLPGADMVKSFPMIFKDGKYIGGYKELCFMESNF